MDDEEFVDGEREMELGNSEGQLGFGVGRTAGPSKPRLKRSNKMGDGTAKRSKRKSLVLVEAGGESDDALPIGSLFKKKRPKNTKKARPLDSEKESPRVEDKGDSEELGNTLASFRKRLKGPKKVQDVAVDGSDGVVVAAIDRPKESEGKRSRRGSGKKSRKKGLLCGSDPSSDVEDSLFAFIQKAQLGSSRRARSGSKQKKAIEETPNKDGGNSKDLASPLFVSDGVEQSNVILRRSRKPRDDSFSAAKEMDTSVTEVSDQDANESLVYRLESDGKSQAASGKKGRTKTHKSTKASSRRSYRTTKDSKMILTDGPSSISALRVKTEVGALDDELVVGFKIADGDGADKLNQNSFGASEHIQDPLKEEAQSLEDGLKQRSNEEMSNSMQEIVEYSMHSSNHKETGGSVELKPCSKICVEDITKIGKTISPALEDASIPPSSDNYVLVQALCLGQSRMMTDELTTSSDVLNQFCTDEPQVDSSSPTQIKEVSKILDDVQPNGLCEII